MVGYYDQLVIRQLIRFPVIVSILYSASLLIKMTLQPSHLLFLSLLLVVAASYALDGQWKLRTSEIPQLHNAKDIQFTFQQSLNGGSIVRQLTVSACNLLVYNFEAEQDQLFLRFSATGEVSRRCIQGQISFIRSVLDTIFYFYILDTTMLLLPPAGPPIKLNRNVDNTRPSINGVYSIRSAITFSPIAHPTVIINGSHLSFCQDSTLFRYVISDKQTIRMGMVRGGECNGFIGGMMPNITLFRVLDSLNGRVVQLYDKQVNLILSLGLKTSYSFSASITPDSFKASQTNQSSASDKAGQNISINLNSPRTQLNSSSAMPNSSRSNTNNRNATPQSTSSSQITPTPIINHTNNQSATFNNKPSTPQPTSSSLQTNNNTKPTAVNTTNKNQVNSLSINQQPTNSSGFSSNSPTNLTSKAPNQTPIYQLARSTSQLYGIWYPIQAEPSSKAPFLYSNYQLIINPARLLLSGPCNTAFSSYSFVGGAFIPQNIIRTQKVCPNNQDTAIQGIIFNEKNRYFISSVGSPRIQIQSEQKAVLLQLGQTAPV